MLETIKLIHRMQTEIGNGAEVRIGYRENMGGYLLIMVDWIHLDFHVRRKISAEELGAMRDEDAIISYIVDKCKYEFDRKINGGTK